MRSVTVAFAAVCLVGVGAGIVVAEGPGTEPYGVGGRIEMSDHGFAVTYPDDWVWYRLPVTQRQAIIDAVTAAAEPTVEEAIVQSVVGDDVSGAAGIWGLPPSLDGGCGVIVRDDLQSLDAYESAERQRLAPVEFMYPEVSATDVELPFGEGRRIDKPMYLDGELYTDTASYAVLGDAGVVVIECSGPSAPPDRWRSFAETFAFLAADDRPATTPMSERAPESQRLEFAGEGVAITVPADWQLVSEEHYPSNVVAWFGSADGETSCLVVVVQRGGVTLDEALASVVPTGYWATLPDGYSTDVVRTTSGEAVQVTFPETVEDLDRTFVNAVYLIPSDEGLYSLQCAVPLDSVSGPDDDWLSIAQTFELLSAEE